MYKVFVYGTLKRGRTLHDFHNSINSEFKGKAITKRFPLLIDSCTNIPTAINRSVKKVAPLKGEIYQVNEEGLKALDKLEEGYDRIEVNATLSTGEMNKVFLYTKPWKRVKPEADYSYYLKHGSY